MKKLGSLILPICLILLCSVLAAAQRTSSSISGTVLDPTGAAVPAATVTATETSTGNKATATSNAQGYYVIPNLAPGSYALSVEKEGFSRFEHTQIVLQVGQPRTVDAALKVASAEAKVITVTGEAALVDTRSQTVSFAITPQFTEEIPLNGRDILQLIALAPDTSSHNTQTNGYATSQLATNPTTKADGSVTASGEARENTTAYYLDGGLDEDAYTAVANVLPNPDAVQEFTVETNSYNAKWAGKGGAVVNVLTKSGSNQFHGSAFEYLRNNYVNANNFFSTAPDTLKRNQFGFSAGGPLVKNHTFWFGSFQRTTFRYASNSNIGFGPTANNLKGDWSDVVPATGPNAIQLTNPMTGEVYAGNKIPANEVAAAYNPISLALLKWVPTGDPTTGQFNYVLGQKLDDSQYVAKVDHNFGDRMMISGSYLWDKYSQPDVADPKDVLTGGPDQTWTNQHAALNLSYRLSNNLLTTTGVTLSRALMLLTGSPAFKNASLSALGANYPKWDPSGTSEEGFYIGGWFTAYWIAQQKVARNQIDLTNNWTYIKGSHSFDFGAELPFYQSSMSQAYVSDGYQGWWDAYSGYAPLDFMLGSNDFYEQYAPSHVSPHGKGPALYANDTWHLRRNLTVNVGVRWDPWLPWPDSSSGKIGSVFNQAAYAAGITSTRYPNLPPGLLVRGDVGVPDGLARANYNSFDPRIGIAWDVNGDGKTSIRVGFGIYHDQPFGRMYNQMSSTTPFTEGTVISGPIDSKGNAVSAYSPYDAYPFSGKPPALQNPPSSSTVFPLPLGSAVGFSPNFKAPATMQWNLTFERQIPSGILVRAAYEGSESYHMFDSRDINTALGGAARPMSKYYGGGVILNESIGTSSYNGLALSVEKRMTKNLSFLGGYRWAKCLDLAGSNSSFAFNEFTDALNPKHDRGTCDSDIAEQIKFSAVWKTPKLESLGFAGKQILGGWTVSGILQQHDGFPFSVLAGRDLNGDSYGSDRAIKVGNPFSGTCANGASTHTRSCWFNPAAYTNIAPTGTEGNSGRNSLRGPHFIDVDLAMVKTIQLHESQKLDFRAEAFNLFNHPNFLNPGNSLTATTSLAQVQQAYQTSAIGGIGGQRVLQFALKFIF